MVKSIYSLFFHNEALLQRWNILIAPWPDASDDRRPT